MSTVAVVIPVYKTLPSEYEKISLEQCIRILGKYDFVFCVPSDLDTSWYEQQCNGRVNYTMEPLHPSYFNGIEGYNRLLLSSHFYQHFRAYRYILIHQLDVFVFRDELLDWCSKQYDYIGAPWIREYETDTGKLSLKEQGGNGGLSLRKVDAHLQALKTFKSLSTWKVTVAYFRKFHSGAALWARFPLMILRWAGYKNNNQYLASIFSANEDVFWSEYAPAIFPWFKPAPVKEEIAFAFEKLPAQLFEMNKRKLPFGCHAWEKHDPGFWKPFISGQGYKL